MLENDIIEESISPWRSQCLVVKQKRNKWRLCIDYSQSVNRYTELDAFPLPRIDELINELSKHHFFSKYDLKNAYHQIPLHPNDKKLTAFEANGKLLQFKRIPFELTNAVGAFQRMVTQIIKEDGLVGTGTNEVSGTSQFSLLSLPRAIYGAGQATLGRFGKFLGTTHILSRRDLGDSLK